MKIKLFDKASPEAQPEQEEKKEETPLEEKIKEIVEQALKEKMAAKSSPEPDEADEKPAQPEETCAPEPKEPRPDEDCSKPDKTSTETGDGTLYTRLEAIETILAKRLKNSDESLRDKAARIDELSEKYERLMTSVQEDRYRKDKVKLISKIIFFTDLIRRMLYEFNQHRSNTAKSEETVFLEQQFEKLIVAMDDTLKHEIVSTMPQAAEGADFDEEHMEAIDTIHTDNASLDGKVHRSLSACYVWTLPYILKARIDENGNEVRNYRFVLHPEEVILYKYNK